MKNTKIRPMILAVLVAATPVPALTDDWQPLDAEGISDALTGRTLQYDTAIQDFRASGKTRYTTSEDSWGNWSTRGDQYCSQWPPSATWNCYDLSMSKDGKTIRFVGAPDDVTDGRYID